MTRKITVMFHCDMSNGVHDIDKTCAKSLKCCQQWLIQVLAAIFKMVECQTFIFCDKVNFKRYISDVTDTTLT